MELEFEPDLPAVFGQGSKFFRCPDSTDRMPNTFVESINYYKLLD